MDRKGHERDPELKHTAVYHGNRPGDDRGWYVDTWIEPQPDDPAAPQTKHSRSGPHTIDAVTALLKAIQDDPEPPGSEARKARDELIENSFHEWIIGTATRLAEAQQAIIDGDPPDYEVPELIEDVVDAAERYQAWSRDIKNAGRGTSRSTTTSRRAASRHRTAGPTTTHPPQNRNDHMEAIHPIAELLHLAVTSGARNIEITTKANDDGGTELTIADDGAGTTFDALRDSPVWDRIDRDIGTAGAAESRPSDDPAKGWTTGVMPRMAGMYRPPYRAAVSQKTMEHGGTRLTVNLLRHSRVHTRAAAAAAARHLPLPVTIDGEAAFRTNFFEAGAFTNKWDGAMFQVHKARDRYAFGRKTAYLDGLIMDTEVPMIEIGGRHLTVRIDLSRVDPSKIERDRDRYPQLAPSPWLQKLAAMAERAVFLAVAEDHFGDRKNGRLALDTATIERAARADVKLEAQGGHLRPWHAKPTRPEDEGGPAYGAEPKPVFVPKGARALIVDLAGLRDGAQKRAGAVTLERALARNGMLAGAYEPNDRVKGQAWYDALPRIEAYDIVAAGPDGSEFNITKAEKLKSKARHEALAKFQAPQTRTTLKLVPADEGRGAVPGPLPTDMAMVGNPDKDDEDCFRVLVAPETTLTTAELRNLLMQAYFTPEDEDDGNEHVEFRNRAEYHAARIIAGDAEADLRQILRVAHNELPWRLARSMNDDLEVRWSQRGDRMTAEIVDHATGETATRTIWGIDELEK